MKSMRQHSEQTEEKRALIELTRIPALPHWFAGVYVVK